MPRSPKENEEIRSARRAAILVAATRVFADKGFARTKISDIAAEAQLSHGLVYHYFDSKAGVFAAIADAMMARIDAELEIPYERAMDRIVASIERERARLERPVDEQRVMMQAFLQGSVPEPVKERLAAHFSGTFARLRDWIAEAQADGDIDASVSANEVAATLICLVRGMSLRVPGMPELPFALPQPQTIVRLLTPPPGRAAPRTSNASNAAAAARRGSTRSAPKRKGRGSSDAKSNRRS